jgi:DHA1 family multidrug resistance protein-like MFS transporter
LRPAAVDWRRNLAALWFAEFTAIFGFAFAFPFLPIFLKELGVNNPGSLAVWTGWAAGASGIALAIASPIWGVVADRFGRKSMLIRAMIGGAVSVGLLSLSQRPEHVVVLRLLQGAFSGTVAAATALVASGTPRNRVGWAMGILTSSIAVGGAVGPVAGGLLATFFGLRWIFVIGAVLLLVSAIPVWFFVQEAPVVRQETVPRPVLETLRLSAPGTLAALSVLLTAQAVMQMSYAAFQPLLVLQLLARGGGAAAGLTGLTFGLSGIASALAAVAYTRAVRRVGYVPVAAAAAVLLAVFEALAGFDGALALIVVAGALAGFFYGVVGPAVSSMIGLETPHEVQARVFGVSASATAIGFGIGPLAAGQIAAARDVPTAIACSAVLSVLLAVLLRLRGREPSR